MYVDKFVLEVAIEYKRAMRLVGRGFSFPKATNITNTYQYRAISAFVDRCKKVYRFDNDMIKEAVHAVVQHACTHGLLKAGATLLNRPDVIDICCDTFSRQIADTKYVIDQLKKMNDVVNSRTVVSREAFFKARVKRRGYPNLITLRANSIISDPFICLSKSAMTVLLSLPADERDVLLPVVDYLKMRIRLASKLDAADLVAAFGKDLLVKV